MNLYINDESIFTAEEAAAAGYVQEARYSDGFLTLPGTNDYAELITEIKVTSSAVDGRRKPKTFKTLEKAAAYIKEEGWAHTGVSDDGVTRLDGIYYRHGKGSFSFNGEISRRVRNLARA